MKIKQYMIVEEAGMDNLVSEVNRLIKEGWQPLGGYVQIMVPGGNYFFSQALVK